MEASNTHLKEIPEEDFFNLREKYLEGTKWFKVIHKSVKKNFTSRSTIESSCNARMSHSSTDTLMKYPQWIKSNRPKYIYQLWSEILTCAELLLSELDGYQKSFETYLPQLWLWCNCIQTGKCIFLYTGKEEGSIKYKEKVTKSLIDRKSNVYKDYNKSPVLIKLLYHWLGVNVMFRISYISLSTNTEWKKTASLHKLYIQEKKEQIYYTDLALPEFFSDQEKAISQVANTIFRKVTYDLKEAEESYVEMSRDMWTKVVKQWIRGKKDWNWRG